MESNFLDKFNVIFHQKIGVNWFNNSLETVVLHKINKN